METAYLTNIFRGDILKLFYCYSPRLKDELIKNGIRYQHTGIHKTTQKTFWVFNGDKPLNNYLESRRQGKN